MSNSVSTVTAEKVPERWVSVKTAAEHYELSIRTIERLISSGSVPVLQIGRSNRVRLSEIEKAGTYYPAVN